MSSVLSKDDLIAIQLAHIDFIKTFLFVIITSFLGMHYQYVFYTLNNRFACFIICENHFFFL